MQLRKIFNTLLVISILVLNIDISFAQGKRSQILVKIKDITKIKVKYKHKSKNKAASIACYKKTPGITSKSKGKLYFTSFTNHLKNFRKNSTDYKKYSLIKNAGAKLCKASAITPTPTPIPTVESAPPTTPTSTSTPTPAPTVSLEKYAGTFGATEARILYNRFGFGGTPQEINEAVALGLDGAVNKLLTFIPEPELMADKEDIECDTWLDHDPNVGTQNKTCSKSNINDFNRDGIRLGLLYSATQTKNPFFFKTAFWLMDERLATSHTAARDCEKHAIKTYLNNVFKAATTGDYIQYMRDMNNDHLMHLRWLDGATNRGGTIAFGPNENWAREFWELGTLGSKDLNEVPNYSDIDVARAALVFTGWNITQTQDLCVASYVPLYNSPGARTVFAGTPYQSSVSTPEELLQATFKHPRAAEYLAEDLWAEYINPNATPDEIRQLAAIIRQNNFNLIPVFRTIMTSQTLYSEQSRSSLIKHANDLLIGFMRTSGIPIYYRNLDTIMGKLAEQPLLPTTVFGWDPKYLAGEQLQIEWWNTLMSYIININVSQTKTNYNWSFYDRFVSDLYKQGITSSSAVVEKVASELSITLTDGEKAELEQMMNFSLSTSNCPAQCAGRSFKLVPTQYTTAPNAAESGYGGSGQKRIRLLVATLLQSPKARLK